MASKKHGLLGSYSTNFSNDGSTFSGTAYTVPAGRKATATVRASVSMGNTGSSGAYAILRASSGVLLFSVKFDGADQVGTVSESGLTLGPGEVVTCSVTGTNVSGQATWAIHGIEEDD